MDPSYPFRNGLRQRIEEGIQHGCALSFDGVAIDIHTEVPKLGVRSRTADLVWSRTVPYQFEGGPTVLVLDPEAQLFSFLTHLLKDRLPVLFGFVDVVRIVDREEIDWDFVAAVARADGLEAPLRMTLDTVFDHLERPRPAGGSGCGAVTRPRGALCVDRASCFRDGRCTGTGGARCSSCRW